MKMRFLIYGFLGWCIEIVWTGLGSLLKGDITLQGWTYIWMFPIYGMAVFLEPVHNRIRDWPVVFRGGVYTLLIFGVEFTTGTLLRMVLGVCPWDYTGCAYSVNGLIRIDYAPFWFIAGLLFEQLHNQLTEIKTSQKPL